MSVLLYPPYLQWEVVSDCNHKCIHCYNYWRTGDVEAEQCTRFYEITEQIVERKPLYVAITGGEPMLVFESIKPCISKMVDSGITVSISTNGTLITEEIAKFLAEKKIDLVISFLSIDKKICDAVTCGKDVVEKLYKVFPLLKKYGIQTTLNIVINKMNLNTLYDTLKAVKDLGFVARVGMAQRPINASKEYLSYELDRNDFKKIVDTTVRAKRDFGVEVDFSVCIPDCAFDSKHIFDEIQKGDCFAGTIAYAIGTNGDVKACQCDTRTYGNILKDSFAAIYKNMAEWRNGSLIPKECADCNRLHFCRGGCRVESFASTGDYRALPTFADLNNVPVKITQKERNPDFQPEARFFLSRDAVFLQDAECCRVSVGITAVHLMNEFARWLTEHESFSFGELLGSTKNVPEKNVSLILNMLIRNKIVFEEKKSA